MEDKALGLLGLMRRAGAVHLGEDKALDAISTGKVRLLLLSADVSDRARRQEKAERRRRETAERKGGKRNEKRRTEV